MSATQLDRIETGISRILALVELLLPGVIAAMSDFENQLAALQAQVAQNITVEQGAITLINGLASQLAANAHDPAAIQAIAASLQTSAAPLAAAITQNTPAATPPAAPPAGGGTAPATPPTTGS